MQDDSASGSGVAVEATGRVPATAIDDVAYGSGLESNQMRQSLLQAQKMDALARLTGGLAHDFNNLLTVVIGNATALRLDAEARGDTKGIRRAEMIERAADRGSRISSQLLAFSRNQMLRPESISAYGAVSAMHELLAQAAGEGVRVRLLTDDGVWNCRVDPGQLDSAILNLVLNARDAMPLGGNITISCHNQTIDADPGYDATRAAGDYVRIDIRDTGTGIPPDLLDSVFEPFFTTKPIGKGSGLGLAQVHGFAGQSGGWVDLESQLGRGTRVSLYLPRARDPQPDPVTWTEWPPSHPNEPIVMVVEPDADVRTTICEILSISGYRAVSVTNASCAIALLSSDEPVHVLLTESRLPGGVNGITLVRDACRLRPDLRILMMSGSAGESKPQFQGDDRKFEFLQKPYQTSDLLRILGALLKVDTFSIETEQLLIATREVMSPAHPSGALGRIQQAPQVDVFARLPRLSTPGARKNEIRLGVMPFKMIGSIDGNGFSSGLAEEITGAFSRFRWITCIAPASVAAVTDEPIGQTARWRELDLDFLVEGTLRTEESQVRILARLLSMRGSGEIIWARRFDSTMPDILKLQDEIASETAAQVAPELLVWEAERGAARPRVNPTAYDLMVRAIPAIYRLDQAGFRAAGPLLERSLDLDPSNAACHSWLAHWYLLLVGQGWATDSTAAIQRADQLARRAVFLDPSDARGFSVAGHVRAFLHRAAEESISLHERAIALNPNLALAWCYCGLAHSYVGLHSDAIRHIQHARRLSPHDPHGFFFDMALMMPLLLSGNYEAAVESGRRARIGHPGLTSTYKGLLSALGLIGLTNEAAILWKELSGLEPRFSVREAILRSPLRRQDDLDLYAKGLRLAGVPESSD
jgi:signal transduction histidine kinase/TolB-like protein/FixJ family two-component response regulator